MKSRLDRVLIALWVVSLLFLAYWAIVFLNFAVNYARFNRVLMYGSE